MEQQYGISDLRQYINERSFFQPISQPPDILSGHRNLPPVQHYPEMVLMPEMVHPGGGFHSNFHTDSATAGVNNVACGMSGGSCLGGLGMDSGGGLAGDGGTGRWPRQETLTLLEIRSRIDSQFKESNQKGPLWEEVSRIMSEEHGYQRSGKKCREKFENLYKYYKKTKDGKAGRQDGKHYRFFRQLEALYGETSKTSNVAAASDNPNLQSTFPYYNSSAANNGSAVVSNQEAIQGSKVSVDSLSFSNSSDFSEDATVDNESVDKRRKRKGKQNWKVKIKDFVDSQMRKLVEKQEVWTEKMMRTIEENEKERLKRENEWRKQQADRIEKEQKIRANERAWIEERDRSLMECLREITGKEIKPYQPQHQNMSSENLNDEGILETLLSSCAKEDHSLSEHESTRLIQVRTSMEPRFQQMRCPEEVIWEEIATKMACFGYDRSGSMYKEKWDCISNYFIKNNTKKRKEDSRSCCSLVGESMNSQVGDGSYSCSGNEHWLGSLRHAQADQNGSPGDDDGAGSAMPYGGHR